LIATGEILPVSDIVRVETDTNVVLHYKRPCDSDNILNSDLTWDPVDSLPVSAVTETDMNAPSLKYRTLILTAALVAVFSLTGCVVVDAGGHDFRTQQQKDDDMAKDALNDSMGSLSKEDQEAIRNLGK
jgi:hypothetical protein